MAELLDSLDAYARIAADRLGASTQCSLILREHHVLRYVASSDPRAARCDQVEVARGEGPCVLASQQIRGEIVPDVLAEVRWPAWRAAALECGFRSAAAVPARVDGDAVVALNLYSPELDPWDRETLVGMDVYAHEVAEAIRTLGLGRGYTA